MSITGIEKKTIIPYTNHKYIDIFSEYIDYSTTSIPICSGKYFEIKQELDYSYEDYPIHEVKNVNLGNFPISKVCTWFIAVISFFAMS